MSASTPSLPATASAAAGSATAASGAQRLRPSFLGILRGELLKLSRQRATWFMLLLLAGVIFLPFLVQLRNQHLADAFQAFPLQASYRMMGIGLFVLRVFGGIFLAIVSARLIGMEYSGGTIRVLLGRGVGRLQLLGAKLLALALVALGIVVATLIYESVLSLAFLRIVTGNLDALKALNSGFWSDTWLYLVTVLLSMAVTVLMATAVTVISRSLAVGLTAAIAWFPADNIGTIFFFLAFRLTDNTFWTLATGDLLGPNLNVMPRELLPSRAAEAVFGSLAAPLVPVSAAHTLLITGIYAAAFVVVAVVLTWRRDVLE